MNNMQFSKLVWDCHDVLKETVNKGIRLEDGESCFFERIDELSALLKLVDQRLDKVAVVGELHFGEEKKIEDSQVDAWPIF